MLEDYCKSVGRTKPKIRSRIDEKSYLIRKAVLEGRGFRPIFSVTSSVAALLCVEMRVQPELIGSAEMSQNPVSSVLRRFCGVMSHIVRVNSGGSQSIEQSLFFLPFLF